MISKSDKCYLVVYSALSFVGCMLFMGGSIDLMAGQDIIGGSVVQSIVVIAAGVIMIAVAVMGFRQTIEWMGYRRSMAVFDV